MVEGEHQVFVQRRWKSLLRGLGCLAFVVCGLFLIFSDHSGSARYPEIYVRAVGVLVVFMFGLVGLLTLRGVVAAPRLILTPERFQQGRAPLVKWRSLAEIEIINKSVCYRFREPAQPRTVMDRLNKSGFGIDGFIQPDFGLRPQEMHDVLQPWWARHG